MKSLLDVRLGVQRPQIAHRPPDVHTLAAAEEAIELADRYAICSGHPLAESQKLTLRAALGERKNGTWAASIIGDFGGRQGAGKTDKIGARELAGLVLFGEQLQIHTAHKFETANESFLRMVAIFENYDDLRRRVAKIRYANGVQSIEFISGQRLKYLARTNGSGRGFARADLTVYDEAQHVMGEHVAASGPARLSNPNPQGWYAGSGGFAFSRQAWRLRRRALSGTGGRLAYTEFTAEDLSIVGGKIITESPDPTDRDAWAQANPGLGRWVTEEAMEDLRYELGDDLFARECLCIWEPEMGSDSDHAIPPEAWRDARGDDGLGPSIALGFDVNPDRTRAAIVASDGRVVELIVRRNGVGWAVDRLVELHQKWKAPVALDPASPAGTFLPDLIDKHVPVIEVAGQQYTQACGAFYDAIVDGRLAVRDHPDLDDAVHGAARAPRGDAWVWSRKKSDSDVSPLVAATLARWAASRSGEWQPPRVVYA